MILVHINWDGEGGFYYFSELLQEEIFKEIGNENYIKFPKWKKIQKVIQEV